MKTIRKFISIILILCLILSVTACGESAATSDSTQKKTITIAYQGGIAYAPIHVLEAKKLIEKNYDGDIEVVFQKLDSGAVINEGIIGGTIQIGAIGVAPAISGVIAGIPYTCISNLSAQSTGLMSNDPSIKSFADIKPEDKIALVNTGSIQHIMLAMAAEKFLGDAHALDNNIQPMSHAEGMAALESGTVKLHLTSSPFIYQERDNEAYNELTEFQEIWPAGTSFIVAMASNELANDEKLLNAVNKALEEAFDFMHNDKDGLADIEVNVLGLDKETILGYLNESECIYESELTGLQNTADFMYRAGFITSPLDFESFKLPSVKGN